MAVRLNVTSVFLIQLWLTRVTRRWGRERGLEPWVDGLVQMFVLWIAFLGRGRRVLPERRERRPEGRVMTPEEGAVVPSLATLCTVP